jgi:DsbC/DsbD-like thiol-disulfide interchange protein
MKMKYFPTVLLLSCLWLPCVAQVHDPVKWKYEVVRTGKGEAALMFTASLEEGWHIYSQFIGEDGPLPTAFTFAPGNDYQRIEGVKEQSMPVKTYDETFMMDIAWFDRTAVFVQKVKLRAPSATIKGKIEFMACTGEMCLPPEEIDFVLNVEDGKKAGGK